MARNNSTDTHIALRIRQIRKSSHLTQSKLAHSLGISLQQVQKYESGVNRISAGRVFDIAAFLGIPVEMLFPARDSLPAEALDPEMEVVSFLSNAQNWQLYSAFRRITDIQHRNTILELAKSFAG